MSYRANPEEALQRSTNAGGENVARGQWVSSANPALQSVCGTKSLATIADGIPPPGISYRPNPEEPLPKAPPKPAERTRPGWVAQPGYGSRSPLYAEPSHHPSVTADGAPTVGIVIEPTAGLSISRPL
jgi:hypothetical protein